MKPSATARLVLTPPRVVDAPTASRHDWQRGLLMVLAAVLALGLIDANGRRVEEREARERAESQLADYVALHGLPNPAIVLDARNAERLGVRLADIAGGLDAERAKVKGLVK